MTAFRRLLLPLCLVCCCGTCLPQNIPQLQSLKAYAEQHELPGYERSAKNIYLSRGGKLNYFNPLYQLFREEKKFRELFGEQNYYDELSGYLSFTGDYLSALQYAAKGYDTLNAETQKQVFKTVDGLKAITHADARKYISFLAQQRRVIMINEAHHKPLHRAFVISLLADLYKKGFRYLGLEMLNNFANNSPDRLTAFTGHYTSEPLAGEMVRIALATGYTLVAYEDTLLYKHTPGQRDSIQAENLYAVLKHDTTAKMLVLGSYGHIASHSDLPGYTPMAMAFKKISGIDPLTIDQTDMTEESNFEYGRLLYRAYTQKYSFAVPSVALINNEPVSITNNSNYDLSIIHPPTQYRDGRPLWLALNGLRKPQYIKPAVMQAFFIQAYYQQDAGDKGPDEAIPADQTYITTNNGNFLLYLKPGKYIVVFRDLEYKILGKINLEVN